MESRQLVDPSSRGAAQRGRSSGAWSICGDRYSTNRTALWAAARPSSRTRAQSSDSLVPLPAAAVWEDALRRVGRASSPDSVVFFGHARKDLFLVGVVAMSACIANRSASHEHCGNGDQGHSVNVQGYAKVVQWAGAIVHLSSNHPGTVINPDQTDSVRGSINRPDVGLESCIRRHAQPSAQKE